MCGMRGETSNRGRGGVRGVSKVPQNSGDSDSPSRKGNSTPEQNITIGELSRLAAARGRQPHNTHTHFRSQSTGRACCACSVPSSAYCFIQQTSATS